jgi:hypothetical protein
MLEVVIILILDHPSQIDKHIFFKKYTPACLSLCCSKMFLLSALSVLMMCVVCTECVMFVALVAKLPLISSIMHCCNNNTGSGSYVTFCFQPSSPVSCVRQVWVILSQIAPLICLHSRWPCSLISFTLTVK